MADSKSPPIQVQANQGHSSHQALRSPTPRLQALKSPLSSTTSFPSSTIPFLHRLVLLPLLPRLSPPDPGISSPRISLAASKRSRNGTSTPSSSLSPSPLQYGLLDRDRDRNPPKASDLTLEESLEFSDGGGGGAVNRVSISFKEMGLRRLLGTP
ncbi:hypothetical protein MPH_08805 [Macrophomina phaseolina MS6]|uniref:Uncharacterized protein n=1 Tax=Macrophomina phaseolina (strain MS6) TaxID=1126212 RepID=K2RHK4_MACPH|nr:hypothetical protein MPH_08805 [Macrophomina phaseolina MS6]